MTKQKKVYKNIIMFLDDIANCDNQLENREEKVMYDYLDMRRDLVIRNFKDYLRLVL